MNSKKTRNSLQHYYVDESGSGVIFDAKGRVLIGSEGCSSFFIIGLLAPSDPVALNADLTLLKSEIMSDRYFSKVHSIRKRIDSGQFHFHAKDDVPEVRKAVYEVLLRHDLRFSAVVRDMNAVLKYVRQRESRDTYYRYRPDELYDNTVRMLFRDRLHKKDEYIVHFAKRASDRTNALRSALNSTRENFLAKWHIETGSKFDLKVQPSWMEVGLQATDYFLWALQRFFERSEDRYIEYVWEKISTVWDLDDKSKAGYGVFYTRKRPLDLAKIANRRI